MDLKLKLRNLLYYLQLKIDNNDNTDINQNGESLLLREIIKKHRGEKFVLFDIGANIGNFSSAAIKMFREIYPEKNIEVHAFEPLLPTFVKLQQVAGEEINCRLINSGISEIPGISKIHFHENADSFASLYKRVAVDLPSETNISLIRLESYMAEQNISVIDFLKIDTEGHELSVLKSAGEYLKPTIIKAIQFEYGGTYIDARIYLKDIYTLLDSKGYRIYKIYPRKIKPRKYHPSMENFQYANFIALGNT
ncbi:MAG: FkbM family methyltransferase [Ginsengibacter sp.]